MSEFVLPQRLIVTPQTAFNEITAALGRLGFRREHVAAGQPMIRDEPEIAAWSFNGTRPHVFYSFNPVVRLRVLDCSIVPPFLRKAIADQVPTIEPGEIRDLMAMPGERERLLGLWATQEEERIDLIPVVAALAETADPLIADEARTVLAKLERCQAARLEILGAARLIAEAAVQLIEVLRDPRAARSLVPDADGCARIFTEDIAGDAAGLIRSEPPEFGEGYRGDPVAPDHVAAAPAGLFRWHNELSERFPRGYRNAAGWLQPDRIWVAWKGGGEGGGTYDGLVFLGDRWALLPRPFHYVGKIAFRDGAEGRATRH